MSLDNLPVQWFETTLDQIAEWGSGGTPSRKNSSYYGGDVPWIKTGDLGEKYVTQATEFITDEAVKNSSAKFFKKGSVIMAMYGATIGKTSILGIDATTNQACAVGTPIATSTEFLYYFLRNEKDAFIAKGKGGAQPNISQQIIKAHSTHLPPLAEQQEIVRQLDGMLAQVEQIKARLDAIPAILKKFRQSVLADAVSGRLLDDEVNSSIYTIKDIFEVTSGIAFKKSEYTEDGYKLLQIANVSHGKTKWETLNFISEQNAKQFDNCMLQNGDVVVALNRPITHDLLKIAKITEQDLPAILYQRVACLRVKENKVADSEFLFLSMQTTAFRKAIEAKLRGSDQPYLNTSDLGNLTINLIPLNEQKLTLKKIRILLSKSNQMEIIVQSAQKRVNLLTQSILAKAFSGELTAEWREQHQDLITGVNSTKALLAKIQAEREASKPVKKTRKKKEA